MTYEPIVALTVKRGILTCDRLDDGRRSASSMQSIHEILNHGVIQYVPQLNSAIQGKVGEGTNPG